MAVVIPLVILNAYCAIVMKMFVNSTQPVDERFSWSVRNDSKVARKYLELRPDSVLPLIFRCSYWVIFSVGLMFIILRLKSPS